MLLCVYVGVTDQSGIVWSTFAVCCFQLPPSLVPLFRRAIMHVGNQTVEVEVEIDKLVC